MLLQGSCLRLSDQASSGLLYLVLWFKLQLIRHAKVTKWFENKYPQRLLIALAATVVKLSDTPTYLQFNEEIDPLSKLEPEENFRNMSTSTDGDRSHT